MLERLTFMVTGAAEGSRLDRFLRLSLPDLPAKSVTFAIGAGEVRVDGTPSGKGRRLRAGEVVTVGRIARASDWLPAPGVLPDASVLYADDLVAVLDKPADAHTEPQRPGETGTLAGFLLSLYPAVREIFPVPGLTLLTRLDYATSGAVPAALTRESFGFLAREREKGMIRKAYVCLVAGRLEEETTLSFELDTRGGEKVRVRTDRVEPDPRYWTVAAPIRAAGDFTLVRATIAKGKRHQIRAHLAAAGLPIVGDRRYSAVPPEGPGKTRLMLHAAEVSFVHPGRRERMAVVSPLPVSFGIT